MSFFEELKRRNIFKVAIAYVVVGWLLLQVSEILVPALYLPNWVLTATAFFLFIGFLPAMIFAWAFELTPEGLRNISQDELQTISTSRDSKGIMRTYKGTGYSQVVRFETADGQQAIYETNYTSSASYDAGETFTIFYRAEDPGDARLFVFERFFLVPLILCFMGFLTWGAAWLIAKLFRSIA